MSDMHFNVNIDAEDVLMQYQRETAAPIRKTQFDTKNYLNARLGKDETSKTLIIRLLPFSAEGGTPFQKVMMHTVRVNKELSPSGWKTFVCPIKNYKDGVLMGDNCPFCETSAKARELKQKSIDEPTRKKYGDVEFMNRAKEMWIVRCIERGHEEDGVKFWMFSSSKKHNGVFDQIINLVNQRAAIYAKRGEKYNLLNLDNGMDLMVTLSRTTDNKTSVQVLDAGERTPLTDDKEQGEKWIKDDKKWYEVYTVKPYDYMAIVASGGVPVYDKTLGKYVDKAEATAIKEEAKEAEIAANYATPTRDYSSIVPPQNGIIDGETVGSVPDLDLPF